MKVKWEMTAKDENDLIAHFGKYILRVERMDKKHFWYCVYFKNQELVMDSTFGIRAESLREGKNLAETIMFTHKLFC